MGERWRSARSLSAGGRLPRLRAGDDPASYGKHAIPWAKIFRNKGILAMVLSYFAYGYVAWMFFAWMYIYMATARGLNLKSSAIYAMFPFIAMTVGCLLGGVVSDWIAARFSLRMGRCLLPGIALALTAVLLLLGSRAHDARTAALAARKRGRGAVFFAKQLLGGVSRHCRRVHGRCLRMMNMGGQLGGALTASLTPVLAARFGWETSFLAAAMLALLGGLAWIVVDPKQQIVPAAPARGES